MNEAQLQHFTGRLHLRYCWLIIGLPSEPGHAPIRQEGVPRLRYLFEDFALDVDKRELLRKAAAVSISPQALDLLIYLIRHRERVIRKDDLISAIWGDRIITDAALATRLNSARVAIGDSGEEQRLIKTLQRKGFRFVGTVQELASPGDAAAASSALQRLEIPDKPSIAVLPFENLSGDPEQEYFGDGLVDDITTALSRFRALFVIARTSSFTYKGKTVDIKQVGAELGVRYVLEGSVRKAGDRLRINGQLIDATTGAHLWADQFDGTLDDIFDLQDKVTQQVVGAIAPEVDRAEIERARRRSVGNIDAVTAYYRGLPHIHFPTNPEHNDDAWRNFNEAIALDPSFSPAYGGAVGCLAWRRANRWPGDYAKDNAELSRLAERAKELGTNDAFTLSALGFNLFWMRLDFDRGLEMVEQAIQSNPNYALAYNYRGLLRAWHGASDTAVADFEQAMRLSPRDPFNYNAMMGLAVAYHNAGRHREAAEWVDKSLRAFPPAFFVGMTQGILCYVAAGRLEDGQRLMAECLRQVPGWRRATFVAPQWFRSTKLRSELVEAFITAGLPE
jgi:TolB-like protein